MGKKKIICDGRMKLKSEIYKGKRIKFERFSAKQTGYKSQFGGVVYYLNNRMSKYIYPNKQAALRGAIYKINKR